jgi:hypothetical protein
MKYFAIIIGDEVVQTVQLPEIEDIHPDSQKPYLASDLEKAIAIYSSDPRIIPTDAPVSEGSIWDGQDFTPPVE